jgi:hypothetical protein
VLLLAGLFLGLHATAQGDRIIPGPPPDEYVDVTGDGRADLLITSHTVHIPDPEQPGYLGKCKVGVRTIAGTAVLMWSTPSNQRWYTLDSAARLDTAELAARIHFKQLSWTDQDKATEFWLLERPFGPAITADQDGWYGTGDHHEDRTMVLRSANDRGTSIAAFSFELPFPYGRVVVRAKEAVRVPNGYGEEGDPVPPKPKVVREYEFGHEESEPQVIVPPGVPSDERVNLNGDEVDDVVITGRRERIDGINEQGRFVRGISPMPGTQLLMSRERWGVLGFFKLHEGEVLTPERLANGLGAGVLTWADGAQVFIPVAHHPVEKSGQPQVWSFEADAFNGALVFRTMEYSRPTIGTLEVVTEGSGGQFGVRPQTWVEEGQVLEVR